jgi:hypothetical protein
MTPLAQASSMEPAGLADGPAKSVHAALPSAFMISTIDWGMAEGKGLDRLRSGISVRHTYQGVYFCRHGRCVVVSNGQPRALGAKSGPSARGLQMPQRSA